MSQLSAWLMGGRLAAAEIQVSILLDNTLKADKTQGIFEYSLTKAGLGKPWPKVGISERIYERNTCFFCPYKRLTKSKISVDIFQVGRPDRDCPGGSERLAIIAISPDTIR